MSRRSVILFGLVIGSVAGGYVPTLLGADSISFASLWGSIAGGTLGIWLAFKYSR